MSQQRARGRLSVGDGGGGGSSPVLHLALGRLSSAQEDGHSNSHGALGDGEGGYGGGLDEVAKSLDAPGDQDACTRAALEGSQVCQNRIREEADKGVGSVGNGAGTNEPPPETMEVWKYTRWG